MNPELAFALLLEDEWWAKLLRQAVAQFEAADLWGKAYWSPYVEADMQRLGAWRALIPVLAGAR